MIQEAYLGDYRHTRDPKVWKKQDGKYAMVIGSKVAYEDDYCGKALFYESEDGIHFEYKNSYQEPTIEICGNVQMSLKSMINSL